ncbi:MAG: ABC transporter permease [Armatimonadetes bacterium]|nr:ABC transporter permease [Armatimonadota bacterium]
MATTATLPQTQAAGARSRGALWRSRPAVAAATLLALVTIVSLAAPLLTPYDPSTPNVIQRLLPPPWAGGAEPSHPLGTDQLGRDVLARLMYGGQISILVGFSAVALSGAIGVTLGLIAGYYGGWIDDVIMRIADFELAFPFILLAIAILAVLGPGLSKVIIVLAITGWAQYCRLVRAQVLSLREMEFVEAARALGARTGHILFRHVLPNTWAPVIVIGSFSVAGVIIAEASLSFLGLGVPPTTPTWGGMLAQGREYIERAWWLATFPGLALMLTVLSINVFGDKVRDALDPRLRGP